jgi:hypothetical protein
MAAVPVSKSETVAWIFRELQEFDYKMQYVQSCLKKSPMSAPVGSRESKDLAILLDELKTIRIRYRGIMPLKHRLCQRYQLPRDPDVDQYYARLQQTVPNVMEEDE